MGDIKDLSCIKILIVGESNVGKTCLIERYIGREFDWNSGPHNCIKCYGKLVELENYKFYLSLFGTAGAKRFHSLIKLYSLGTLGCLIVYDVTNRESFDKLEYWFKMVLEKEKVPIILIGNKIDSSEEERKVSEKEGMELAKKKCAFFWNLCQRQYKCWGNI